MNSRNNKITIYFILFSLIIIIGVVYATLQANLQINGTAKISENQWNVHFENIVINQNSVPISTGDVAATIDPTNNCKVDFSVTLSLPGDFYEFTVDVENDGTIDAMIGTLTKTLKVNNVVVETVPDYLIYSVTYEDDTEILENHLLAKNTSETYKVRVEFKRDIDQLPTGSSIITTSLEPQFIQADSAAISVRIPEVNFATDSWDSIVAAYNAGVTTSLQAAMEAGTTRDVDLGTLGVHPVRIANLSNPTECSQSEFSKSACGFVLEFTDSLFKESMNLSGTNVGGWPNSYMHTYLNNTIYNYFPDSLKNNIKDTKVISGHGSTSGEENFISYDKLYLPISKEVSTYNNNWDTAYNYSRLLDYYKNSINVYCNKAEDSDGLWYRSAYKGGSSDFGMNCSTDGTDATDYRGISPLFRIG